MSTKYIVLLLFQLLYSMSMAIAQNLEDQKAYMEAQIELLKKETDLNAAMKTLSQVGGESLPSIVSIGVQGTSSYARLLLPNGASVIFAPGESIKKGLRLLRIEERAVWVQVQDAKGAKKELSLEFAQVAPAQSYVPSSSFGILPIGGPNGGTMGGPMGAVRGDSKGDAKGDAKGAPGVAPSRSPLPDLSQLGFSGLAPPRSLTPSEGAAPLTAPAVQSGAAPAWMSRRTR